MNTDMIRIETPHSRDISAEQYALIQIVATTLHGARYYQGISSEHRAAYLMARAYELGFPATAAPDVIDDIQGKLTLKPQAAWALVLRSGLLEGMQVDETDDYCEVKLQRADNHIWFNYKFTMDAAKKADLVKQGGAYEKWGKNMLYWRALGFCIDRAFPDVTVGLKDAPQFGGPIPSQRVTVIEGQIEP